MKLLLPVQPHPLTAQFHVGLFWTVVTHAQERVAGVEWVEYINDANQGAVVCWSVHMCAKKPALCHVHLVYKPAKTVVYTVNVRKSVDIHVYPVASRVLGNVSITSVSRGAMRCVIGHDVTDPAKKFSRAIMFVAL